MGLARIFRTKDETIVIPSLSVVVKFLGFDTTRGAEIGVGAPREDVILRGEKCDDPQFFQYLPAFHTDPRAIEARRLLNEVHCEHYAARHATSRPSSASRT